MTEYDDGYIAEDAAGQWWFADETSDYIGPFVSRIVALLQLDRYVVWLTYGEAGLADIETYGVGGVTSS